MPKIEKSSSPLRASPQSTLKIDKSERTRVAILNAALEFVWSHPFRDMTVNSVMASTGVGRSAFYQYFSDLHEVMETLLTMLQEEIFTAVQPWLVGVGDPIALMQETLAGLVDVSYQQGPFLRAITDAASTDSRLENAWLQFLAGFDDAATARYRSRPEAGSDPGLRGSPRRLCAQPSQCLQPPPCVRAAPEEAARTGAGGAGPDLDFHVVWQRVARERVLGSSSQMTQKED